LEKRTVSKLQSGQPWIDPERTHGMQVLKYTTSDGHKMDAYVTIPEGASKTNKVPLVVMPHGGPWSRSSWGYQGEPQFFASRGYAVLQTNYRGSIGYDWKFSDDDRVDFLQMSDDVTQSVKTLLKTGMIDTERVAIVGGGFGGYLVLQGLIDNPELYACGFSHSGIYDWSWLANELGVDRNRHPAYGAIMSLLGDPGRDSAKFDALSPAREVARLETPIMVARERDAQGLMRSQTVRLVNGLRTVEADFTELLVEGSMAELANQIKLFQEIESYFADKMGMPTPPMAAAASEAPEVEFKLGN
jgi:dipeptidyl aminopeptidase/acylaminoacyl peptidase